MQNSLISCNNEKISLTAKVKDLEYQIVKLNSQIVERETQVANTLNKLAIQQKNYVDIIQFTPISKPDSAIFSVNEQEIYQQLHTLIQNFEYSKCLESPLSSLEYLRTETVKIGKHVEELKMNDLFQKYNLKI